MIQVSEGLYGWDDLGDFTRAGILTLLFFLSPALAASGFSDDMVIRFFQTLGITGVLAFGFLARHDLVKSADANKKDGDRDE